MWCLHKPSECKLRSDNVKKEGKQIKGGSKERLKMKVYQSLFESSSEEEGENQEDEDEVEESDGSDSDDNSNTSE
jgi:hypothetical protein